jgi:hypothetical protein
VDVARNVQTPALEAQSLAIRALSVARKAVSFAIASFLSNPRSFLRGAPPSERHA